MNRFRGFLLHISVVCSFVCITAKILDWYNPYMDFAGHIWFVQLALYVTVIIFSFMRKTAEKPKDTTRASGSMMPDQKELIVRILKNLTPDQRAAILSKRSIANTVNFTEKMQH